MQDSCRALAAIQGIVIAVLDGARDDWDRAVEEAMRLCDGLTGVEQARAFALVDLIHEHTGAIAG